MRFIQFSSVYTAAGDWVDDMRSGSGKYYYANGDTYEGDWNRHLRHGQGTYIYLQAGLMYSGGWVNGKRDGTGKITRIGGEDVRIFI